MAKLTFAEVDALLKYDPETGKLFWKERPGNKRFNTRFAGKEAFTADDGMGYKQGCINYRLYRAHTIAWTLANGFWPSDQIDHINGVKSDNRLSNLRDVNTQENSRNSKMNSNNSSGVVGVYWVKRDMKWAAMITVDGSCRGLGRYKSFADAVQARKAGETLYGFHQNHGREVTISSSKPSTE